MATTLGGVTMPDPVVGPDGYSFEIVGEGATMEMADGTMVYDYPGASRRRVGSTGDTHPRHGHDPRRWPCSGYPHVRALPAAAAATATACLERAAGRALVRGGPAWCLFTAPPGRWAA